jgi:hypothetical protein
MATKKKVTPKAKATTKTTPKRVAQSVAPAQDMKLCVLTFCFALLCITFAVLAFWRYG